jgi:hypothetical protein
MLLNEVRKEHDTVVQQEVSIAAHQAEIAALGARLGALEAAAAQTLGNSSK